MRISRRGKASEATDQVIPDNSADIEAGSKVFISHAEVIWPQPSHLNKAQISDGDVAKELFDATQDPQDILTAKEEERLQWKIDLMILPYLAVCYMFFYIDKTTLSYAAIFGIQEDLGLVGTQYSWLSSVFYFGFLVWAFPTNFLMQKFPIGQYLGINIFMWGVFLMLQACARNFTELAVLRALSGAAEACADPSFMLITSMWYTRRQQPIRIGIWYTANGLGIAGGGLLGYAIGNIKSTLASWKYEFLIIGALCCIWGIVLYCFLPNSPVTARQLSTAQRRWVIQRLSENQTGVENKHLKGYQVIEAFKDYKLTLFFLIGVVGNIPNWGISNFGTIIIKGFGFTTLQTTLMQIPYGFIISASILICVFLNDHVSRNGKQTRCYFIVLFILPNIAGSFGLCFLDPDNRAGRLVCYYLTGPYNAAFVLLLSLQTANTAGHTKKVVTNACLFLGYCVGNISGPFFYKPSQSPTYKLGIWSMIICYLLEIVLVLLLRQLLSRENRRRDEIQGTITTQSSLSPGRSQRSVTTGDDDQGVDQDEEEQQSRRRRKRKEQRDATAFSDLTDRENLNFRYLY